MGSAKNEMCRCTRNVGTTKAAPSQTNNGVVRSWADCAAQCKLSPKCHAWVQEERGDKLCNLKSKIRIISGAEYSTRGGFSGGLNIQCDMQHTETTTAADTTTTTAASTTPPAVSAVATEAATSTVTTTTATTKQPTTPTTKAATSTLPPITTTTTDDAQCPCSFDDRFYFGRTIKKFSSEFKWTGEACWKVCASREKCTVWIIDAERNLCILKYGPALTFETRRGFTGSAANQVCACGTTAVPAITTEPTDAPTEGPTEDAPTEAPAEATTQALTRAPSDAPTDAMVDDVSNQCMHQNRFYFGKTYASIAPSQANNGLAWTWSECAMQCKFSTKCHAWALEERGDKFCHLKSKIRIISGAEYSTRGGFSGGLNLYDCDMPTTTPTTATTTTHAPLTTPADTATTQPTQPLATDAPTPQPTQPATLPITMKPAMPSTTEAPRLTSTYDCPCAHKDRFYFGRTIKKLPMPGGATWLANDCWQICAVRDQCAAWVITSNVCLLKRVAGGYSICHLHPPLSDWSPRTFPVESA